MNVDNEVRRLVTNADTGRVFPPGRVEVHTDNNNLSLRGSSSRTNVAKRNAQIRYRENHFLGNPSFPDNTVVVTPTYSVSEQGRRGRTVTTRTVAFVPEAPYAHEDVMSVATVQRKPSRTKLWVAGGRHGPYDLASDLPEQGGTIFEGLGMATLHAAVQMDEEDTQASYPFLIQHHAGRRDQPIPRTGAPAHMHGGRFREGDLKPRETETPTGLLAEQQALTPEINALMTLVMISSIRDALGKNDIDPNLIDQLEMVPGVVEPIGPRLHVRGIDADSLTDPKNVKFMAAVTRAEYPAYNKAVHSVRDQLPNKFQVGGLVFPKLPFEVYSSITYIDDQGKLTRGYAPIFTYSAHGGGERSGVEIIRGSIYPINEERAKVAGQFIELTKATAEKTVANLGYDL
jgi:hypothetical protein